MSDPNQDQNTNHPARRHPALTFLLCGPAHIMTPPQAQANQLTAAQIDEQARARNAAAQARHRAKRKAYVAELEENVASLRETLKHATTEGRLKELEEENKRLTAELAQLKAQLEGGLDDGLWTGSSVGSPSQVAGGSAQYILQSAQDIDDDQQEVLDPEEFGLQGWTPADEGK